MSRKRGPDTGGGSPVQKKADFIDDDNSDWYESSSDGLSLNFTPVHSPFILSSQLNVAQLGDEAFPSQPSVSTPDSPQSSTHSFSALTPEEDELPYMMDLSDDLNDSISPIEDSLVAALSTAKEDLGSKKVAELILESNDLKEEIKKMILDETHKEFKNSLKHSILSADKKDRKYLLSLSPKVICEEFSEFAPNAYQLIAHGLLGLSDQEVVLGNQHLTNNVSMLISTAAKCVNRKASGYGLLLTTVARDGGMREDSLRIFCNLCHPRTAQKYDQEVLSKDWDTELQDALAVELLHFQQLQNAEHESQQLSESTTSPTETSTEDIEQFPGSTPCLPEFAAEDIELMLSSLPPQCQMTWDNLNLRTKHRHERQHDKYEDSNFDWMASLWIQERISGNHMKHSPGEPLKDPASLSIQDFVPSQEEENYLFTSLVHYYASRLTYRHPKVFKTLNSSIKASFKDAG